MRTFRETYLAEISKERVAAYQDKAKGQVGDIHDRSTSFTGSGMRTRIGKKDGQTLRKRYHGLALAKIKTHPDLTDRAKVRAR